MRRAYLFPALSVIVFVVVLGVLFQADSQAASDKVERSPAGFQTIIGVEKDLASASHDRDVLPGPRDATGDFTSLAAYRSQVLNEQVAPVGQPLQPANRTQRRENAPPSQGLPPRTGPASAYVPLETPNFGPNYRANTDPQSPNLAQQEPSIAVNPTDPLNVVAAAKDERAGPNTKHIWIYTSTDGGVNWLNQKFPIREPTPQADSDPVVTFSDDGICYVTVLPYNPCCEGIQTVGVQVARSFDGGITFEPATQVTDNGSADKEWTYIDNFSSSPFYHRVYVAWMDLSSSGVFRLTYSTDRGQTWIQSPVNQPAYQFPMPLVYPSGDVSVVYHSTGGISNIRSTDGGATWGSPQFMEAVTEPNCPPDNPGCSIWRLNLIPVVAINADNGNAVATWSDGRDGTATVYYARGTSDGQVWGPAQVLAPPGVVNTYQVEPWVTVDERGISHAIWYDDRDSPNSSIFHIYYSQSTDDGQTWSQAVRISTASSDLRVGIPSSYALAAGDYINVTASHGNVYAAWTDTRSGIGEDIYVVRGTFGGTPTPTFTGTPPTATSTRTRTSTPTRTNTPTPTPTVCGGGHYIITQGQGTIVPGVDDVGNHCDDCVTTINLPFAYRLYDSAFGTANVSSNGNLQFNTTDVSSANSCIPIQSLDFAILPHWDDLRTDGAGNYGIFTSTSGQAPNRIFNIEWRTQLGSRRGDVNFEVRLYEGQTRFDIVYGTVAQYGTSATVGVQDSTGVNFTQFECNTGGLGNGVLLTFVLPPCGTPTNTATGTPPTATFTLTPTPTVCVGNYGYVTATATIEPGTDDIGNHCDDCTTTVYMPFPVRFYDQQFTQADASSNGNLQFTTTDPRPFNICLPSPDLQAALMPHWDDLMTDAESGCPTGGCGIFTSLSGQAPNRVFNIEWRAVRYSNPSAPVNFEIRLYEGQERFDFVYGQIDASGADATVGEQNDVTLYTQFSCLTPSLSEGLLIEWTLQGCNPSTGTPTSTPCPGCTPTETGTPTTTRTVTPTATSTPCGLVTYIGSITNSDPTQVGRVTRDGVRSLCEAPKNCPGVFDGALRHYDSYTLTNNNPSTQCVTVDVSTMCIDTHFIFVVAYLDNFDPSYLCDNYLADIGSSPYPYGFMTFEVPSGHSVVLVVSEVTTNEGCDLYTLDVRGLGICGTPTSTPTGTPPTATSTPTNTATPCGYAFVTATATIVPGTNDTGIHCDDCVGLVQLPFPFRLYGTDYSQAVASSNGNLQFVTDSANRINTCLPAPSLSAALLADWTDLVTDCVGCGVFTSVSGAPPDRTFNIEWRAGYFKGGGSANFEVRLYEGTGVFEFVYGQMSEPGYNATVGVQNPGAAAFDQYECNSGGLTDGLVVRGIPQDCGMATSTPTSTATVTAGPSLTPTPCSITFTDVHPSDYFYEAVTYLYCHGVISGYADNTFRPYNSTTRGQMTKIVVLGFAIPIWTPEPSATPTFSDVPPDNAFYQYIETAAHNNIVSGYADGTFRPFNNVTRGQLSKIIVIGATIVDGWPLLNPPTPTFLDVPPDSPFYTYIETAYCHQIISGYSDGTFRPGNDATRGQISKIQYLAILNTANCAITPTAVVPRR